MSMYENYIAIINNLASYHYNGLDLSDHTDRTNFNASIALYKQQLKQGETNKTYLDWLSDYVSYSLQDGI